MYNNPFSDALLKTKHLATARRPSRSVESLIPLRQNLLTPILHTSRHLQQPLLLLHNPLLPAILLPGILVPQRGHTLLHLKRDGGEPKRPLVSIPAAHQRVRRLQIPATQRGRVAHNIKVLAIIRRGIELEQNVGDARNSNIGSTSLGGRGVGALDRGTNADIRDFDILGDPRGREVALSAVVHPDKGGKRPGEVSGGDGGEGLDLEELLGHHAVLGGVLLGDGNEGVGVGLD